MSYASQGVIVFPHKKGEWVEPDSDLLILVKKTGYYNFWIDGKHYFYDEKLNPSHIENSVLLLAFNGGKKEEKKKKKGKITVTKKRK